MKQIIILLIILRAIGGANAQAGYSPYVVLSATSVSTFADTMEGKYNLNGAGFVYFHSFTDANGYRVCDSALQSYFPTQFASLSATGWTPAYVYDGCFQVPSCAVYEIVEVLKLMFFKQATIAASRTVSIVLHDTTMTQALSSNIVFPLKIPVAYSGATDGSGDYSVTFATPYSVAPNIQATLKGATNLQGLTATVTTTGFTVHAWERNVTTLLGIVVLRSTVEDLVSTDIDVLITEK